MTEDEEENAVRQLGELIGYSKLILHARRLMAPLPKPIDLKIGRCIHGQPLSRACTACEKDQQTPGA
jgi:hypothetical protein